MRKTIAAFAYRSCQPSRRAGFLVYSAVVVAVLFLLAYWLVASGAQSYALNKEWLAGLEGAADYDQPASFPWMLTLAQVFELADVLALIVLMTSYFVVTPALTAAAVANERSTGTFDQLRTTPTRPLSLLAGFVFGAPLRVHLLMVGPWLVHFAAGLVGPVSLAATLTSTAVLIVGALAATTFAVVLAVAPQKKSGGALLPVMVGAVLVISGLIAVALGCDDDSVFWAFSHPAGAVHATYLQYSEMWRQMILGSWTIESFARPHVTTALALSPLWSVLMCGSAAVLLGHGAVRRFARPGVPLLGQGAALGLFSIAAAVLMLPMLRFEADEWASSASRAADGALVCGALMIPVMACFLYVTQRDARVWSYSLRRGGHPKIPWGLAAAMIGVFSALLLYNCLRSGVSSLDLWRHSIPLAWLAATGMSLALHAHFCTARFSALSQRSAFTVAIGAHVIFQLVCIGVALAGARELSHQVPLIETGVVLAVAVPSVVMWRLNVLRQRVLAVVDAT